MKWSLSAAGQPHAVFIIAATGSPARTSSTSHIWKSTMNHQVARMRCAVYASSRPVVTAPAQLASDARAITSGGRSGLAVGGAGPPPPAACHQHVEPHADGDEQSFM